MRSLRFWKPGRHVARADAARDRRDWTQAAKSYAKYLKRRPENAAIWIQLGHMLKEDGRYSAAADAYHRATLLTPDDAELYLHIGYLNKLSGNPRASFRAFQQSLLLNPGLMPAKRELGLVAANPDELDARYQVVRLEERVAELLARIGELELALGQRQMS